MDIAQVEKLSWLFGNALKLEETQLPGNFIGPRKEMVTPWSTNAVEITQTMGVEGINRIEEFVTYKEGDAQDPMLQKVYEGLDQEIFTITHQPEDIQEIDDIADYNEREGLALSKDEIDYLHQVSHSLGRKLTDSEVFGFSQVNSEHCRHKIFNGSFIIDGEEKEKSLFQLIKETSAKNPNRLVSAYKDNVAFVKGPRIEQFAPKRQDVAEEFDINDVESILSLKAETHNFPTTVEPFNGAATGSGGEIRDRMAGGRASIPLAGTAVYMTSYPRLTDDKSWEQQNEPRPWLYQTPLDILIKASNGASDFGNKFGQPLICGSLLTFELNQEQKAWGYDKVVMLAGGVGFGYANGSHKGMPEVGDKVVVLGGDNYRIGMGGGSVSSVATGQYGNAVELNAIQRSNPEMQKRVFNAIRGLAEMSENPIVSIHDHGAGGHLNCLSELLEETGGVIDVSKLPVGDPTLSAKEIIGNESQERMGLIIKEQDLPLLQDLADRERAPMYVVGEVTGDMRFKFENGNDRSPMDWELSHMFGSSPKTVLKDASQQENQPEITYDESKLQSYLEDVLSLEAVACKDWLTNKVDRCVSGRVAKQQTAGPVQLPLNNVAVMALDFQGKKGVATSIGHAPVAGLINPAAGSRLAVSEALLNLIWAPIEEGLAGVSLSANWMWPAKNEGENARLYEAVEAVSKFSIELGINVPTGKDSLSMTQKYPDGKTVYSPGTVIISSVGEVTDLNKVVEPVLRDVAESILIFIDFSSTQNELGGSSFAQTQNQLGSNTPDVSDSNYFKKAFDVIQDLIKEDLILSGHDISAGGLITTLLELCFSKNTIGLDLNLSELNSGDIVKMLFSENPGIVIQVEESSEALSLLSDSNIKFKVIGRPNWNRSFTIQDGTTEHHLDIDHLRDTWYDSSHRLDSHSLQSGEHGRVRFENYKKQSLRYNFKPEFTGKYDQYGIDPLRRTPTGVKAAIIREKGINSDREMAWDLYLAGFDVKDIHMTDLISGREDLADVNFIVFTGGFSNSDVLGSAKGWAGAFLYNDKAKAALENFYARENTLSLGVCNGCQLMMELGLIYPEQEEHPKMHHNSSGKFECSFLNVDIPENNSVMLKSMAGSRLGIWMAHGEGKFNFPLDEDSYEISGKYSYSEYPGNPNGSDFDAAFVHSKNGRHLAMMPHLERSMFPWNWAHYPEDRKSDQVSPWIEAFVNAKNWVVEKTKI